MGTKQRDIDQHYEAMNPPTRCCHGYEMDESCAACDEPPLCMYPDCELEATSFKVTLAPLCDEHAAEYEEQKENRHDR